MRCAETSQQARSLWKMRKPRVLGLFGIGERHSWGALPNALPLGFRGESESRAADVARHQVYDHLHAARQAMPRSESIPSRDARRRGEYRPRGSTILAGAPAAVVCPWPCDCPPESDKTFSQIWVLSSRPSAIDSATFTTGCWWLAVSRTSLGSQRTSAASLWARRRRSPPKTWDERE